MKVYIISYKTEQGDTTIGAVYTDLDEAKDEAERLDNATSWGSALIVPRDVEVPRELTPEQARWFNLDRWMPTR